MKLKRLSIVAVLLLSFLTGFLPIMPIPAAEASATFEGPVVIYDPGSGYGYSWGNAIVLANGDILQNGTYGTPTNSSQSVKIFKSSNNGTSWALLSTILPIAPNDGIDAGSLWLRPNGDVWIFSAEALSTDNLSFQQYYRVSTDSGATWGSHIAILPDDPDPLFMGHINTPPILLSDGVHLIIPYNYSDGVNWDTQQDIAVIYNFTTDNWTKVWVTTGYPSYFGEWTLFEAVKPGGGIRVVGLTRKDFDPYIYRFYSDDLGLTWSTPAAVYLTDCTYADWQSTPYAIKVDGTVYLSLWYRRFVDGTEPIDLRIITSTDDALTFGTALITNQTQLITDAIGNGSSLVYLGDSKFLQTWGLRQYPSVNHRVIYSTFIDWDDPDTWWDSNWLYRKKINFNNSAISENITNSLVTATFTSANLDFSHILSTGYDVRFVDAGSTPELKYYRASWNATAETADFIIQVPQIDASSNSDYIWMYYGNTAAGDGENKAFTADILLNDPLWGDRLQSESSFASVDSYGHTNTVIGTTWGTQGRTFDGIDDYIDCTNNAVFDITTAITLEAWAYWTGYVLEGAFLSKAGGAANTDAYILATQVADDGTVRFYIRNATAYAYIEVAVSKNVWHHFFATYDSALGSNQMMLVLDGGTPAYATQTGAIQTTATSLKIGHYGSLPDKMWNGKIGEVRIYNVAKPLAVGQHNYLATKLRYVGGSYLTINSEEGHAIPTVTTQAASSIEATTATGNGDITYTGGDNPTIRGGQWGTSTGVYTTNVTESGTFGTGAFTVNMTSLPTGTTVYFRAEAYNTTGWGYGEEVTFLTIPDAPTNVSATDGSTANVTITWTQSAGATGYYVLSDNVSISGLLGDVATYTDTAAAAPVITSGNATASDGTSSAYVSLSLSGVSVANGTSYTYTVIATNASGNSTASAGDAGYRGYGTLTYQWQRSATDNNSGYSNISGATMSSYNDTGAPSDGSGRYFKAVLDAVGASQQTSTPDRGYRIAATPTPTPTPTTYVTDIFPGLTILIMIFPVILFLGMLFGGGYIIYASRRTGQADIQQMVIGILLIILTLAIMPSVLSALYNLLVGT